MGITQNAHMTEQDTDGRGQVGIGTLIVFIALILVAAVAAAVLVETAGFLQGDAEATGQDARDEVSNQIDVVTVSGATNSSDQVETANLTVKKSPGSSDLDLSQATIQYTSGDTAQTLTHDASNTSVSLFTTSDVTGTSSGEELTSLGDRAQITLDLSAIENGTGLGEGEEATVEIVDQSGATTVKVLNVPPTIGDDDVVRLN